MRLATPTDTPAIYDLLRAVQFQNLPEYEEAKAVIEGCHTLVIERDGKIAAWVNLSKGADNVAMIDVAVLPEYQGKIATLRECKQVLTYCLGYAEIIRMEAYNPRAVKLALLLGFKLTDRVDEAGWTTLELTKADLHG